ncbi:MAG: hypothetical protein QNJ04_14475 [Desulfobacterales bacterium]|nr:hypothetical protein [Desulfobacterales bacterium]
MRIALILFIFFDGKENEPKEIARAPLHPVRRCQWQRVSEIAALRQADTLYPPLPPMLGAGQKGRFKPQGKSFMFGPQSRTFYPSAKCYSV